MPRKASFAAAYVQCLSAKRRQKLKKLVAVVSPIAVVSGRPSPLDPLVGLSVPAISEVHGAPPALFGAFCSHELRAASRTLFCLTGNGRRQESKQEQSSACPRSLHSNSDATHDGRLTRRRGTFFAAADRRSDANPNQARTSAPEKLRRPMLGSGRAFTKSRKSSGDSPDRAAWRGSGDCETRVLPIKIRLRRRSASGERPLDDSAA
jgi:hypothetical protein